MILVFSCQSKNDLPKEIVLNTNWSFKKVSDSIWLPATVPGNVHSDLLANKRIKNPFVKDNELQLDWISESNWEYKTTFNLDKETLQKKHIELNLEGLDIYASVFLNDILILSANNAFREWNVDVKSILKAKNRLKVIFESTSLYEEKEKSKLPYTLPEENRIFTRKAQFQYGWDWAPKLNTVGIWKSVSLQMWNDFKIEDVFIKQLEINNSMAFLLAEINLKSKFNDFLTGEIFVNDSLVNTFQINPNNNHSSISFQILNPKLWWTYNLGEPYLYDIEVVVRNRTAILDTFKFKKGLRTIELVTEKDSIGESFYFKLNNVPVYAKGANYIPQNSLQNKVTNSHYEKLLNDVVAANMNMLRVWGGGIYENDVFYQFCDEKGILIWQDFMFACAMYPGDKAFLKNVQQEAIDNVKRLRNYASIALWCGNNENSEGWYRWGWQNNRSEKEKEEIWTNYLKIFDSILPNTVKKYTDKTSYWESSPRYGRGNPKYKLQGDAHDWWIWHDAYPFEHLEDNVPRFMSEFGFQSLPSYKVINYINQTDSIDISSESFKTHQKHSRGFQLINEYMKRDFPVPTNAEDYVYMSQLLQAYGITKGIEAHRRAKPYNMGTLYWQLNDCWPSVSWSSIDFFGNWKALHYKAKNAFKNVLISSKNKKGNLNIFVVNDELISHSGKLSVQIIDFNGKVLFEDFTTIEVVSNSSKLVYQLNLKNLPINKNEVVIVSKFKDEISYFYLVKPKDLKLKQEAIQKRITKTKNGFQIELSSKTLQKDVFLFCKDKGQFSDNYFDLLPKETKTIRFKTQAKSLENLQLKTFNSFIR